MLLQSKARVPFLLLCLVNAFLTLHGQELQAPAPGQSVISTKKAGTVAEAPVAAAPALFSIGEPTDDEQLYLELINRARANPSAEVERLIALDDIYVRNALQKVNTNMLVQQFGTNPPAAPLSFNSRLINAARAHTQYQFDNSIQSHIGPGTNTLAQRLQAVGYPYYWATENVYSYSQSTVHGHAAFEIDWSGGFANGGMQTPPSHRDHIHDRRFVEIGIGVLHGTNKVGTNIAVGPQLVTQDFGTTFPAKTYITGVAYYDLNTNNFYDVGEGLSGVTVTVDGINAYAITSASGGYSIPVTPGQNYTVRFKAAGAPDLVNTANVATTNSVKLDFKPVFTPSSVIAAPATAYANVSNRFNISPLAGATAYRARIFTLNVLPVEGAEGSSPDVALSTFGNYNAVSTSLSASGSGSFHLRHLTDNSGTEPTAYPQIIRFVNPFYVRPGARIDFQSRLGIAYGGTTESGPGETARLQISTDEGKTWMTIWSQAGTEVERGEDTSEKNFNARSVALSNYVGHLVMLRFNFDVNPTVGWFDRNADKYGWYIDDIQIIGAEQGTNPTIATFDASATFNFVPPTEGNYVFQTAAVAGSRQFPMSSWHFVSAQPAPPVVSLEENVTIAREGLLSMKVVKVSGAVASITVQSATNPSGPWATESGATVSGPANDEYTVNMPMNGSTRFFRIVAQ